MTVPQNVYSSASYGVVYKLFDKLVIVCFKANISSTIAGSGGLLCTLPVGYRPSEENKRSAFTTYGNSTNFFDIKINTDGTIKTAIGSGTISVAVTIPQVMFLL